MLDAESLWTIALKILGICFVVLGVAGLLPQWVQLLWVSTEWVGPAYPRWGTAALLLLPLAQYGVYIVAGVLLFLAPDRGWLRLSQGAAPPGQDPGEPRG